MRALDFAIAMPNNKKRHKSNSYKAMSIFGISLSGQKLHQGFSDQAR